MKLNAFEGGRRILRVLQGLWVVAIGGLYVIMPSDPYVTVRVGILSPSLAVPTIEECRIGTDQTSFIDARTKKGSVGHVELCFRAMKFQDGRMLIPFEETGATVLGNSSYSPEVNRYVNAFSTRFKLTELQEREIDLKHHAERLKFAGIAVGIAVGGCLTLSVAAAVVGWVVRGFLGIPSGLDTSREPRSENAGDVDP